jgi:hypothetical protein
MLVSQTTVDMPVGQRMYSRRQPADTAAQLLTRRIEVRRQLRNRGRGSDLVRVDVVIKCCLGPGIACLGLGLRVVHVRVGDGALNA